MRIKVSHVTNYIYPEPVRLITQALRLSPRDSECQLVVNWRVSLSVDGRLRMDEDGFGNLLQHFEADGPISELAITVEGLVDTVDMAGVLRGSHEPAPPDVFMRSTALTESNTELAAFSDQAVIGLNQPLEQLHALLAALHRKLRLCDDALGPTLGAAKAFASGKALPRDLSHVFVACARHLGHPARIVSGYLAPLHELARPQSLHSWAESFVPGLGWVGFDVSTGLSPGEWHVRIACGFDYGDVTPVRGARKGGGIETMNLMLNVQAQQ
ncbi:MAG: transglutaminase family protein [Bosea sp. (in: a-proteobacteria)]